MAEEPVLDHARLTTLWGLLDYHRERRPDKIATLFEGRATSYRQLHAAALELAACLAASGYKPGDRIGYLGKNSDRYFGLLFAIARIGAVLVPLNWRLAADELAYIVDDSTMRALFCDEEFAASARALSEGSGIRSVLLDDDIGVTDAMAADAPALAAVPLPLPSQVVFQVYTSGTTGRPKGAMLTNANIVALRAPGHRAGLKWFPDEDSIVGVVLPVAHIAGTAYALFGFYAGSTVAILREFDANEVLALIQCSRVSSILLAPAAMQQVMEHPDAPVTDLSSLAYITYGAAPIPETLLREALAMFGCGFVQMYGMSEAAGGVVALQPEDHCSGIPDRLRSAGTAMPGVAIAVVDDAWTDLGADATGEIVVRSPSNMAGYWNRPDATAEVFGPDGWMRTGDIGRIDRDGYLFVLDRAKDMIISGGENIYPAEVENAVFGHPDVADVAVVGAPSARWGEEVVAVVVPRPGASLELADILNWLDGKLARFKLPKQLVLTDHLPRNAGNKILRRVIREQFWQGHERRVN